MASTLQALQNLDIPDRVIEHGRERSENRYPVPLASCAPDLFHELPANLLELLDRTARCSIRECLVESRNHIRADERLLEDVVDDDDDDDDPEFRIEEGMLGSSLRMLSRLVAGSPGFRCGA